NVKLEKEKSTHTINLIQEEVKNWKEGLESLQVERQNTLSQIDTNIASVYLDMHKKYENPIVLLNDETCSGCHLSVPTTVVKSVRKQEELVRCPNCGRFLYRKVS
ncbi:MAG: zinc ribbon domain-containing protein, partial [Candidatus Caldatribacteriaceae bacterium]